MAKVGVFINCSIVYIFANIEYLMLEESNIKVAQYYTQLPDKKILSKKLDKAIAIAREAKQQK